MRGSIYVFWDVKAIIGASHFYSENPAYFLYERKRAVAGISEESGCIVSLCPRVHKEEQRKAFHHEGHSSPHKVWCRLKSQTLFWDFSIRPAPQQSQGMLTLYKSTVGCEVLLDIKVFCPWRQVTQRLPMHLRWPSLGLKPYQVLQICGICTKVELVLHRISTQCDSLDEYPVHSHLSGLALHAK